jgi:hypothetical protein
VRTAAWNWPCKLLNASDQWGAWACQVMFAWVASLAETVGDTEAATINRKNTATARSSAAAV